MVVRLNHRRARQVGDKVYKALAWLSSGSPTGKRLPATGGSVMRWRLAVRENRCLATSRTDTP